MSKKTQISFVFIDSNNSVLSNQIINDTKPFFKLPFPPSINPRNLIASSEGRTPTRAPNAFIIYRKLFIQNARDEGYSFPMTVISTMASKYWEQEPEVVKIEYRRIAKEAFDYHSEIYPRKRYQGKREKWNIVSFNKPLNKSQKDRSTKRKK